jgi:hypothetical protein
MIFNVKLLSNCLSARVVKVGLKVQQSSASSTIFGDDSHRSLCFVLRVRGASPPSEVLP